MSRFSSVPSSLGVYENGTEIADDLGNGFTRGLDVSGDFICSVVGGEAMVLRNKEVCLDLEQTL